MSYEAVIGLEVHVQLRTERKLLCSCANRFGAAPNTLICPVCLGYPGALPVLNQEAVHLAVRLALALGCRVHERSAFARKSYFYPDLPKGYQITQFDRPLALGGKVGLSRSGRHVPIRRLHLEEDAGKLLHQRPGGGSLQGLSLVDFNRCGIPLVEIVSEAALATPEEAHDFLRTLRRTLLYTGTSDASMERGSLRCDANVSVRRPGAPRGAKTEVKNLNSLRHVARAVEHEIHRQAGLLESGRQVVPETRSYDAACGKTRPLRSKEEEHDYRYFPEPDLPLLVVAAQRLEELRRQIPELPSERHRRFIAAYGLSEEQAGLLTDTPEMASYYEQAAAICESPRALAGWLGTEVRRLLKKDDQELGQAVAPPRLAALVDMVEGGEISRPAAKKVLETIWGSQEEPSEAVDRLGLRLVEDRRQIREWVDRVLAACPEEVARYRSGRKGLLRFFVGQVMRVSRGRASPELVQQVLEERLTGNLVGADVGPSATDR